MLSPSIPRKLWIHLENNTMVYRHLLISYPSASFNLPPALSSSDLHLPPMQNLRISMRPELLNRVLTKQRRCPVPKRIPALTPPHVHNNIRSPILPFRLRYCHPLFYLIYLLSTTAFSNPNRHSQGGPIATSSSPIRRSLMATYQKRRTDENDRNVFVSPGTISPCDLVDVGGGPAARLGPSKFQPH